MSARARAAVASLAPIVLLAVLCGATWGGFLSIGLVGHDSYPVIAGSRIHSFADARDTFREPLMDGRFELAYYRPVANLTVALDERLGGLEARGYQRSNLLWLFASAVAVWGLVRCVTSGDGLAALVSASLYAVHVSQGTVLPVLSRRPESLCVLFLALTLHAQVRTSREGRVSLAPAVWALLAMGAKEPGFLAVPLAFVAALTQRSGDAGPRVRGATRDVAPVLATAASFFLGRSLVLGGVGGPPGAGPAQLPAVVSFLAVLFPQPYVPSASNALGCGLALVAGVSGLLLWRSGERARFAPPALALALAWTTGTALLYAWSGQLEAWYLVLPWVGVAIALGVGAGGFVRVLRDRPQGRTRVIAALGLASIVGVSGLHLRESLRARDASAWRRADAELRACLDDLAPRIAAAAPGAVLRTRSCTEWIESAPSERSSPGVAVISDYGLQAWVDLGFPDREVRVVASRDEAARTPGAVVVIPDWKRP